MARKLTKAGLEAKLAAQQGVLLEQSQTIRRLQAENQELRDQLAVRGTALEKLSFAQLKEKAIALTREGVPCYIHMGHILHAKTKAILV